MAALIRRMGPVLVLLGLVVGPARGQTSARTFDGAGSSFTLPAGTTAFEGWTGDAYILDVRRDDRPEDRTVPFVRIVILPRNDVTPEACRTTVADDLTKILARQGHTRGTISPVKAKISGQDRTGISLPFSAGGKPAEVLHLFALVHGGQRVVVVTKSDPLPRAPDPARIGKILGSIVFHRISKESLIRTAAGPVAFRVPIVSRIEWKQVNSSGIRGRIGLPEGTLVVFVMSCGTRRRAEQALATSEVDHRELLEKQVRAAGGGIDASETILVPMGRKLVTGALHEVHLAKGGERDSVLVPVVDGGEFLGFSFLFEVGKGKAMAARIAQILGSYERKSPDTRPGNRFVGSGLSVPFGPDETLERGKDGDGEWLETTSGKRWAPVHFRLAIRPGPVAGGSSEGPPSPATGAPVEVLSQKVQAQLGHLPPGGGEPARASIRAEVPFGDRHLVLSATGAEGESAFLVQAFRSRLAASVPAGTGPVRISAGPFSVKFDPTVLTAWTEGKWSERTLHLVAPSASVRLSFSPGAASPSKAELADHARSALGEFRDGPGKACRSIGPSQADTVKTTGPDLARAWTTFVGTDGLPGQFSALAGVLPDGFLDGSVRCDDTTDGKLNVALDDLLASLKAGP